jgi:hypothetical protein
MLFQALRKHFFFPKEPPLRLSEEAWRALLAPRELNEHGRRHLDLYKPVWIPVGDSFMLLEDVRRRVDESEYWRRSHLREDEEHRKKWEQWQKEHPEPCERKKLVMIK